MKAYILLVILLAAFASATDMCSDTDNGPVRVNGPDDYTLGTKGSVQYGGISTNVRDDICVISATNEVSTPSSRWLMEYYCESDKREYKIYDCLRYGFTGCENGRCVGKDISQSPVNQSQTQTPVSDCGDHVTDEDAGEECDPPNSVCFGKDMSEYGQCDDNCKCVLSKAVATKCGNGVIDEGENCESDADCEHWEMCKTCICVERPADGATDNVSAGPVQAPVIKKNVSEEIEQKYPTPEIHPVEDVEAKNFTEDPGIKTTGTIARFFMGVWDWIIGLFS